MTDKNEISVIIPTYNRYEEVFRAVDSVKKQTYIHLICDIIIVDDCSKDYYFERLSDLYSNDDLVTVVRTPKNGGGGFSRNYGAEFAKGNLLAFLDSDDIWRKDKIEKQIKLISKGVMVTSAIRYYTSDDCWFVKLIHWNKNSDISEFLFNGGVMQTSTFLITKSDFYLVKFPVIKRFQDVQFLIDAQRRGIKTEVINKPLVDFIQNSTNRTSSMTDYKYCIEWFENNQYKLTDKSKKYYLYNVALPCYINSFCFIDLLKFKMIYDLSMVFILKEVIKRGISAILPNKVKCKIRVWFK